MLALLAVDISKYCRRAQIKQCLILTSIVPYLQHNEVYSMEDIEYSIQLKSSNRILKQYEAQSSMLSSQQSDIYTFYPNMEQPFSDTYKAVIHLSTSNVECAHVYINTFDKPERFSALNSNNSNSSNIYEIIIESSAYLIQIAAYRDNCRYNIQLFMLRNTNNTANNNNNNNMQHI